MAACVTMLTDMQHANAHLHDLCATGKSERDASLLPLIANVKRALEALMYAVVAALEQADMRDALVLNNESRAALPSARKQSTKKRKAQCKVETVVDDSKAGDSDDDNNNNNNNNDDDDDCGENDDEDATAQIVRATPGRNHELSLIHI